MNARLAVLLAFVCACGGKHDNDIGPDATNGCAVDSDCPDGMRCGADHQCYGGCGSEAFDLTYVAPNFIIVLDRSCSMDKPTVTGGPTKWTSAVGSLNHVLATHATDIDWGLTLFPDKTGVSCGQDAIPIPIGAGNASTIQSMLTNALQATDPLFPSNPCVTNIDTALIQAATDPALASTTKTSYVMLVTDGAQSSCTVGGGDAGSEAAITDLLAHDVKTFVVGFGGAVDAAQLDKFAMLGGTAQTGTPKYYKADTAQQLDQVFQSIADLVISCEYTIDPAPPDIDQTYVFFENQELVPRDATHTSGWDYDPATMKVTLYGAYCDRLQSKQVDDVDVVFGCPVPPLF
jgi:hypothetical protein